MRSSTTSSPATSVPDAPAPSCSRARRPTICWLVVGAIYHEACLCWHSCNAASASVTTICSSVCLGNFLRIIHSARTQAAGTTQNNPLKTNGPKNPDPSRIPSRDSKNAIDDQLQDTTSVLDAFHIVKLAGGVRLVLLTLREAGVCACGE